jgi:hypothetical protein
MDEALAASMVVRSAVTDETTADSLAGERERAWD